MPYHKWGHGQWRITLITFDCSSHFDRFPFYVPGSQLCGDPPFLGSELFRDWSLQCLKVSNQGINSLFRSEELISMEDAAARCDEEKTTPIWLDLGLESCHHRNFPRMPHGTRDPSDKIAANAVPVALICCTFFSWSPPPSDSPQVTTEPSARMA